MKVLSELNKFKNITLDERDFRIRSGDQILRSPSSLWKKLTVPFDTEYWSTFKSLQKSGYDVYPQYPKIGIKREGVFDLDELPEDLPVTKEDVKYTWFVDGQTGLAKGNFVNKYVQNKLRGRTVKTEYDPFINTLSSVEVIKFHRTMMNILKHADKFVEDYSEFIPVFPEKLVGSSTLGVGGIIDDIFINGKKIKIVDYKTDKEIDTKSKYKIKCLGYLSEYDDCKYVKFNHQLSWYKRIIEEETNLECEIEVIHFTEDGYNVIPMELMKEINEYNSTTCRSN